MDITFPKHIFTVSKSDYSPEEWAVMQKRNNSEKLAKQRLSSIYGRSIATMIVYNIMAEHHNLYRRWADTYDAACDALGANIVSDIIFRAVNLLPSRGVERRQKKGVKNG